MDVVSRFAAYESMTSHVGSLIPNKAVDLRHDAGKTVAYFTNLGVSTAHIGSTSAGPPSKHRWSSTVRRCAVFCPPSRLLYYYNRIHSWINKGVFPIFSPTCSCLWLFLPVGHLPPLGAPRQYPFCTGVSLAPPLLTVLS